MALEVHQQPQWHRDSEGRMVLRVQAETLLHLRQQLPPLNSCWPDPDSKFRIIAFEATKRQERSSLGKLLDRILGRRPLLEWDVTFTLKLTDL